MSSMPTAPTVGSPHACGEHRQPRGALRNLSSGSPPRVWGASSSDRQIDGLAAVHPHACGEHTAMRVHVAVIMPVHPHTCGEHPLRSAISRGDDGSPPRVWGACSLIAGFGSRDGSPPRVWGAIDWSYAIREPHVRFTPTRVGTIVGSACWPAAGFRFTPRVWGQCERPGESGASGGSPPRVWGAMRVNEAPHCARLGSPPRVWGA